MQQALLDYDVAQRGYCQQGQIIAAVSLVKDVHAQRRQITNADLDQLRNVCRCGTYPRIHEAIKQGAAHMPIRKRKARKHTGTRAVANS